MPTSSSSRSNRTHVLVVDDHPAICETLTQTISGEMDMVVVEAAATGKAAVEILDREAIDVVVVDLSLPDTSGLDLIIKISEKYPDTPSVVYSRHDERIYGERALQAGARGYVMKTSAPRTLIDAIRAVEQGRIYLSEEMRTRAVQNLTGGGRNKSGMSALTDREQAVFEGLGQGKSLTQVAEELGITEKTVEHHRRQAKEKLGLDTTGELLQHAIAWCQSRPNDIQARKS